MSQPIPVNSKEGDSDSVCVLLETTPARLSRPGSRRLRAILQRVLPELGLGRQADGGVTGLNDKAWNRLWAAVLDEVHPYETRRRYKQLLIEVANHWHKAGLIAEPPAFTVPSQHRRRQTVAIDKLGRYRFRDYRRLATFIVNRLCGEGDLAALGQPNHLPGKALWAGDESLRIWLALLFMFSGICQHGSLKLLEGLHWEDVLVLWPSVNGQAPLPVIRLPQRGRHAYVWMRLPPLTWLFLLALAHRTKALFGPIFAGDHKRRGREVRRLLDTICEQANVPRLTPTQLAYFVQYDLRRVLPNPNLAVLLGQLPFTPLPADQAYEFLTGSKPAQPLRPWPLAKGLVVSPDDDGDDSSLPDQVAIDFPEAYAELPYGKARLSEKIHALFDATPPQVVKELEIWTRGVTTQKPEATENLPRFNLAWLIRWLLNMAGEWNLKAGSRGAYWTAAVRVLHQYPSVVIQELETRALHSLIATLPWKTASLTRTAWRRLEAFLQRSGVTVSPIRWEEVKVIKHVTPVRAFTDSDLPAVLSALAEPYRTAFQFCCWIGLRVSEVCHLYCNDIDLTGLPYLIVYASKRGRSRRVPLDGLSPEQFAFISAQHARQMAKGKDAPFISDISGTQLDSDAVSTAFGKVLKALGLRSDDLEGMQLAFQGARHRYASDENNKTGDVRLVASDIGHGLVMTTVGWYLNDLDLKSVRLMEQWDSPLNDKGLHMPLTTLAQLLGVDRSRARQLVKEYNAQGRVGGIKPVSGKEVQDCIKRDGPKLRADYMSDEESFRLFAWLARKLIKADI